MKLGLSIPLFNEADGVTEVVVSIHAVLDNAGIDAHIVLVNNGSDDATGDRIEALRTPGIIETVHLRENAGYGGGICAGLAKLEQGPPPDVIGWCWGDGQVSATALPPLFEAICAGADVAKAVRTRRLDGIKRQVISTSYAATMKLLGVNTPDVNGCPKLMSWAAFQAIATAASLIDMSGHTGAHPRMGATDVCPFVPVADIDMPASSPSCGVTVQLTSSPTPKAVGGKLPSGVDTTTSLTVQTIVVRSASPSSSV
jgi:hypothetical protein